MKSWSYTIKEGEHAGKTVWSGRYCAVAGFIFCKFPDGWAVLANRRGKGTPDFQGYWNCPCGFLDMEKAEDGCVREILEETGVEVDPNQLILVGVETDPAVCNNGNVTLRYTAALIYGQQNTTISWETVVESGGEKEEVQAIAWIKLTDLDKVDWAFGHKERILEIFNKFYKE